jgi:3-dehydroquinate dehydratase-2
MRIAIINGPNLNLLGLREVETYGTQSFEECYAALKLKFPQVEFYYLQSNHEGELIDGIQKFAMETDAIILNPAGYSHTSVAIADAVAACMKPVIEVHISNIFAREPFRHHSFVSSKANGIIVGLGLKGYEAAVYALLH